MATWLTASLGDQFHEAIPLQLAIKLKSKPGATENIHTAAMAPVYYSTPAAAAVNVSPASLTDLPARVILTFPDNADRAYPGFDFAMVGLSAAVQGQPGIRLEVAMDRRDTNVWPATISVHPGSAAAWTEAHETDQVIVLKLESGNPELVLLPATLTVPKAA